MRHLETQLSRHERNLLTITVVLSLSVAGSPQNVDATALDELPAPNLQQVEPQVAERLRERRQQVAEHLGSGAAWGAYAMSLDVHDFKAEALQGYERAATLDPGEPRWPYFRATLLAERGDPEANAWFERALRLAPRYLPLQIRRGNHLLATGELTAARAAFGAASGSSRELATHAHLGLARVALAMGDLADARVQAQRSLSQEPRHRDARHLLAEILRQLDQPEQAAVERRRAELTESSISLPDPMAVKLFEEGVSSFWHHKRGRLYLIGGDFARAAEAFREALAISPRAEFHAGLGEALLRRGQLEEAEAALRAALASQPDNALAASHLGLTLWRRGDPSAAILMLEQAIRLPRGERAATLEILAAAYEAAGHLGQAVLTAERARDLAQEAGQQGLADRLAHSLQRYRTQDRRADGAG
ncbi:MAG: tetratricopeptide repeat protein [Acidobacteriota bacterium]